MRVTTAFNRVLQLNAATVTGVLFDAREVVVTVRRTARRHRCPCGEIAGGYDHSVRRWRHLDLAGATLWLESEIWRVNCRQCGVRTEQVPWARPGARLSRDLEDLIAWLAQRTDKTSICRLVGVAWQTVHDVVARVVAEHLDSDRLDRVFNIGVDEICYKRGRQYLTVIASHDNGRVLHVAKGRSGVVLDEFFDQLGPERCKKIKAISMDVTSIWRAACEQSIPKAAICLDPFHIVRWTQEALDAVYKTTRSGTGNKQWRTTRYAIRAGREKLADHHRALVAELRRTDRALWRAWDLKEGIRDLYRTVKPPQAAAHLRRWCKRAERSRLRPFVILARRLRKNFGGIIAAVKHGLSNSRIEGINAKIRLINKRGFGHPNGDHLIAMIHLCLGGITLQPPTQR